MPIAWLLAGKSKAGKEAVDGLGGRNARMEYLEERHGEA